MFISFFLIVICLFFLGAVIGSFLNVVIYRSVQGESWVWGRSHCDHCKKPIQWYDNIPLLSFFLLQGKCRYCKKSIAITHPVIEFLTGSLFAWWYVGGFFFFRLTSQPFHYIQPAFWLLVGILLLIIFFADALYMIIPDEAVGLLFFLTLFYRIGLTLAGVMQPLDFVWTILGAALCCGFFFLVWFLTKGKGMGFGDVKFSVPFALILGWPNVLIGFVLSFVLGGAVASILLLAGKKKMKHTLPFGPFLILALLITLVFGNQILRWYLGML